MILGVIVNSIFLPINMGENLLNENISKIKITQLIYSIFIFILPPFFLSIYEKKKINYLLLINKNVKIQHILLIIVIITFIQPIVSYSYNLNINLINFLSKYYPIIIENIQQIESKSEYLTNLLMNMDSYSDLLVNIFLFSIIPAIGEEMLFRGVLQRKISIILHNHHFSIILVSILFSTVHMQFSGFIPRFILGLLLGYIFYYSKNLIFPIICHFINNLLVIIFMYPQISDNLNIEVKNIINNSYNIDIIYVVVSIFSVFIFMYIFIKSFEKQ